MIDRLVLSLLVYFTSVLGHASMDLPSTEIKRQAVKDQFVLAFRSPQVIGNMDLFARLVDLPFSQVSSFAAADNMKLLLSRRLGPAAFRTQVLVKKSQVGELVWQHLSRHPQFIKMQPNYLYTGELREEIVTPLPPVEEPAVPEFVQTPNDPQYVEQYHHGVMGNDLAWGYLESGHKTIIVAVTDDGVDIDHEDLTAAIHINPNEIPGNGVDDDNNGFIDDITGWDFASRDNDPRPGSFNEHGTHVAGIVAATGNNHLGVIGTAAGFSKIMPIRFYGGAFTSEVVAESYKYAADNGAQIITTSYAIDQFVGDQVFEDAIAYVYDKDVLHFNSAGNSGVSGPARQAFKELILVCSTIADGEDDDAKSDFSNYGPGIDICAPGGGGGAGILATINDNRYERKSGTSMASPNAAAVAAMIWSKNPTWTRDQVVAQLFGTAKNIDALNTGLENQLGRGRVDSGAAVADGIKSPNVTSVSRVKTGDTFEIKVAFSNVLDPATVKARHFKVMDGYDTIQVMLAEDYKIGANEVTLIFQHAGEVDRLIIEDFIQTPFGEPIDGDGDGVPGGDYIVSL